MTNSKIDRIEKEMQKTREKITEYQNRLKELAAHFPYPISKSGLSHRMKKLEALAAELEEASHGN